MTIDFQTAAPARIRAFACTPSAATAARRDIATPCVVGRRVAALGRPAPDVWTSALRSVVAGFAALGAALIDASGALAADRHDDARAASEEILQEIADRSGPGLSAGVFQNGRTLFKTSVGLAVLDTARPITNDTVFCVGSVSKQFAAYAAQLLIAEGRLSPDDDVREIVPYVAHHDKPILVRDLIHHTSGIKDVWEFLPLVGVYETDALEHEHFQTMIGRFDTLNFDPGSRILYSNSAYVVLADVVSARAGQPFPEFAAARIFKPLGMTQSAFRKNTSDVRTDAAHSYRPIEGGGWRLTPFGYASYGASGLWTTVNDMAKWIDHLTDPDPAHAAVVEAMYEVGRLRSGETFDYAFGLIATTVGDAKAYAHTGSDQGFTAGFLVLPDEKAGVVVLTNGASFDAGDVTIELADAFFDDRAANGDEGTDGEGAGPAQLSAGDPRLESAFGRYLSEDGVALVIGREGDRAVLAFDQASFSPIFFRDDGTFAHDENGAAGGELARDAMGRIVGLRAPDAGSATESQVFYEKLAEDDKQKPLEPEQLVGRYYSAAFDVIVNIETSDDGLRISNFRSVADSPLTPFSRGVYTFVWGTASWAAPYTMTFNPVERGRVPGFSVSNLWSYGISFTRITDTSINRASTRRK